MNKVEKAMGLGLRGKACRFCKKFQAGNNWILLKYKTKSVQFVNGNNVKIIIKNNYGYQGI